MDTKSAAILAVGLIAASALFRALPSAPVPAADPKQEEQLTLMRQRLDELTQRCEQAQRDTKEPRVYGLDMPTRIWLGTFLPVNWERIAKALSPEPSNVNRYQLVRAAEDHVILLDTTDGSLHRKPLPGK